jgi:hypothetical protein
MIKEKPKIQTILEAVFGKAVDNLTNASAGRPVGELHVQIDLISGEIQVYDDHEVLLEKYVIFDWANRHEKGARAYGQPVHFIRAALAGLKSEKKFENPVFTHPLGVLLVDDNFNKIETIYVIPETETFSEGRLLKNLEQDLQNFSKKLFADTE